MNIKESYYKNRGLGINLHESLNEESPEDFIYNKSSFVNSYSGIKKALAWVADKVDDALSILPGMDGAYDNNHVKYNRNVLVKALTNKFGKEVADATEKKYRDSVITAAKELGMTDKLREFPENFGGIGIDVDAHAVSQRAKELMGK